jgi:lipoprotein-anchoring transpeptidase ErfK/SrfK
VHCSPKEIVMNRIHRTVVVSLALAAAVLVAACGGSSQPSTSSSESTSTSVNTTTTTVGSRSAAVTVATATVAQVHVYAGADATETDRVLDSDPAYPLVFLVAEERANRLLVELPIRPNGSRGWIDRSEAAVAPDPYHVIVSLGAHELTVTRDDTVVLTTTIAVGTAGTPTPTGHFYILELLQPTDSAGPYGPYAFGLSAHSDVLTDFGGGDGQVGIHGTNQPAALGTDASHGCIRVANDVITQLADLVPLGTPVDIVP